MSSVDILALNQSISCYDVRFTQFRKEVVVNSEGDADSFFGELFKRTAEL